MGAIIRSIIGANALVTLGTRIPPGSLVLGSPAKVRRALTLGEQKDIARWAWSYVETSKHFVSSTPGNCRASVSDAHRNAMALQRNALQFRLARRDEMPGKRTRLAETIFPL